MFVSILPCANHGQPCPWIHNSFVFINPYPHPPFVIFLLAPAVVGITNNLMGLTDEDVEHLLDVLRADDPVAMKLTTIICEKLAACQSFDAAPIMSKCGKPKEFPSDESEESDESMAEESQPPPPSDESMAEESQQPPPSDDDMGEVSAEEQEFVDMAEESKQPPPPDDDMAEESKQPPLPDDVMAEESKQPPPPDDMAEESKQPPLPSEQPPPPDDNDNPGKVAEPGGLLSSADHAGLASQDTRRYFNFMEMLADDENFDAKRVTWTRWNEFIKTRNATKAYRLGGNVEHWKLAREIKQAWDSPLASTSRAAADDEPQHKKSACVEKKGGGKGLDTTQPPAETGKVTEPGAFLSREDHHGLASRDT